MNTPPSCSNPRRWLPAMSSALLLSVLLAACSNTPSAPDSADIREASMQSAVVDAPPPEVRQQFEAALAQARANDVAGAESAFAALAAAHPTYAGALVNVALLQMRSERLAEAEQTLQEAIRRNAASATAFNQLGIVYRRLGRFKDAEQSYARAVEIDPQHANSWFNLGVLCDLYLYEPVRALDAFERYAALSATPDARVKQWIAEIKQRTPAAHAAKAAP